MLAEFVSLLLTCGYKTLRLAILGEPVPQSRPKFGLGGRVYESKKSSRYKASIRKVAEEEVKKQKFTMAHKEMPVSLECVFYKPIPKSKQKWWKIAASLGLIAPVNRSGDADNILKACSDALNGIAFEDDSQVCDIYVHSRYSENPRTEIIVKAMYVNIGDIKDKIKSMGLLTSRRRKNDLQD